MNISFSCFSVLRIIVTGIRATTNNKGDREPPTKFSKRKGGGLIFRGGLLGKRGVTFSLEMGGGVGGVQFLHKK